MKKKFNFLYLILLVFVFANAGCKKDSTDNGTSGSPGTNEVWMKNTSFTPSAISIAVNTTITWTNKDGMTHTVTDNGGSFNSGNIGNGGTFSHQYTTVGTFPYHCAIHSGMTGTVTVH